MNDQDNDPSRKNFSERLLDYVAKNPFFTLWNISVIIGGIFGYLHYSRIGYIPEIDFKSAATIFIALALTGTFFTMVLVFIFQLPSFLLRLFLRVDQEPNTAIVGGSENFPIDQALVERHRSVGALIFCTAIIAIGIWCLIFWLHSDTAWQSPDAWFGVMGVFLIGGAAVTFRMGGRFFKFISSYLGRLFPKVLVTWSIKNANFFLAIGVWWFAMCFIGLMVNLPILSNKSLSGNDKAFWLTGFLAIVIMANACATVISKRMRHALLFFLLFTLTPAIYFLQLPDNPFSLEKKAFSQLGLGSLENSFFLVKPDACDAINVIRENTCIYVASTNMKSDGKSIGCVRPRFLENRLGAEYLLAYEEKVPEKTGAKNGKKAEIFIPLKKDDVLQWAFGKTTDAGNSQCPNQEQKT